MGKLARFTREFHLGPRTSSGGAPNIQSYPTKKTTTRLGGECALLEI